MTGAPNNAPDVPEPGAERVRLRPLDLADAPGLHEAYGDADSMRFLNALPSRDIAETEANIHAGIKYMRWMIDQYYGKEPMTKLDKALFAFASYNAGAGRISSLRKEAARRGLDPNVWFQNVEYVAAEKIGQETVTYVSNIYKYYIAYRLVMESRAAQQEAIQKVKGVTK